MNLNDVAGFFRTFTGIFSPVFSGLLLAFILSVPKLGIARRLTGVFPRLKEKTVDALSLMACVAVLGRRELDRQCRGFLCAYFKKPTAERICHVAKLTHDTYTKFFSGQCIEVLILGTMIFLAFSVFRIPYAALIAVLTAAFAFVPYIGAFASCLIGVLLTLMAVPEKAILCFIVYQMVQFIENQFIYPHVVGSSVGLSPLWTLLAALLGGKLFGIIGIVFFIPLAAVIAQLLHGDIEHRLAVR